MAVCDHQLKNTLTTLHEFKGSCHYFMAAVDATRVPNASLQRIQVHQLQFYYLYANFYDKYYPGS